MRALSSARAEVARESPKIGDLVGLECELPVVLPQDSADQNEACRESRPQTLRGTRREPEAQDAAPVVEERVAAEGAIGGPSLAADDEAPPDMPGAETVDRRGLRRVEDRREGRQRRAGPWSGRLDGNRDLARVVEESGVLGGSAPRVPPTHAHLLPERRIESIEHMFDEGG